MKPRVHKGTTCGCRCARAGRPPEQWCYCTDPECWCRPLPDPFGED